MSQNKCPKCKEDEFTYSMSEEDTSIFWCCHSCGYTASEIEALERQCKECGTRTDCHLSDSEKTYFWCAKCGKIEEQDKS